MKSALQGTKHLVYVDAENLNSQQISEAMNEVRACSGSDMVVTKFYGTRDVLNSVFTTCMNLGMEFVDTSGLVKNQKNVTDMKISVDAITDVTLLYTSVSAVTVMSQDCDFAPLVYKLMGLDVKVYTPFLNFESKECVVTDVSSLLRAKGFYAIERVDVFEPLYGVMEELTCNESTRVDVAGYFGKKRSKFMREAALIMPQDVLNQVAQLSDKDFSFSKIVTFSRGRVAWPVVRTLATIYTRKMFGFSFTSDMLDCRLQPMKELFTQS